ncbi:uncharacterized protein LOC143373928 [Andrena cerasifolii]|uniref:uncharacterized protein LOC143373928 n=1 Tax=Andrena cerasifolii TaxID=2819439 RepID=UPI004037C079
MNLSILQFLLFPIPIISLYFTNTPVNDSSGIFYNKKGDAQISNTELTLLIFLNITYLSEARETVTVNYLKLQNLCRIFSKDIIGSYVHCQQILKLIDEDINNIDNKHEILYNLMGQKSNNRKQCGLIDGISYLSNLLFGTSDANDAHFYANSINILSNDSYQIKRLLKSQVQIISSTITTLNSSLHTLELNENQINENIKLVNKFTNETNLYLRSLSLQSLITQQTTILTSIITKVLNEYNKYIEAIGLGNQNVISPEILSPKTLCEQLLKYKGDYDLIIEPFYKNIPTIYKLLKLQLLSLTDNIVFVLKFPLGKRMHFHLYELIPLPIQHDNTSTFSYIEPKYPYLLLSQSKTYFSFLQVLSDCEEYQDEMYLCTNVHISKTTDEEICEIQLLLSHTTRIPEDCNTRNIKASIEAFKYIGKNCWVYVLQKPSTVTIFCKDIKEYMQDITLYQTGILQLDAQCKGYSNNYLLETTRYAEKNITYYIPAINIIENDCCITPFDQNTPESIPLKFVKLTNIDLIDLQYTDKRLKDFDEILSKKLKEPVSEIHVSWFVKGLYILGGFIMAIFCMNCCRFLECIKLLQRLFRYVKSSSKGEVTHPVIKNFVNCTFDSDIRSEYREISRDLVSYNTRGKDLRLITEPNFESMEGDFMEHEVASSPDYPHRTKIRTPTTRRSTTPM